MCARCECVFVRFSCEFIVLDLKTQRAIVHSLQTDRPSDVTHAKDRRARASVII